MDSETLNLINKYREYNPEYDRYTDQEITQLGLPGFEQPVGINTIPNQFSYRNQFMTDLKNLPSDFRTSLGQTKDALVEDFGQLKEGLASITNRGMDLFGSGKDLGKTAIGGLISLATGIPGAGLLLNAFQMSPEEKAARDFYTQNYGLTNTGQVASGIMQGYNPVSMFGGPGLLNSIDKRLATILRTEQRKNKRGLELSQQLINRRKELEALRAQEAAAASDFLESQRRGRRPGTTGGTYSGEFRDSQSRGEKSAGNTGGYSYDSGGRQGFGYGL